jgi:hypothetical protein
MNKKTFVAIMTQLQNFYNDTYPKLAELGMMSEDSAILCELDYITEAVADAIDPKNIGENLLAHDSPLVYDFIFSDLLEHVAITPEELYDYITNLYATRAEEIKAL